MRLPRSDMPRSQRLDRLHTMALAHSEARRDDYRSLERCLQRRYFRLVLTELGDAT